MPYTLSKNNANSLDKDNCLVLICKKNIQRHHFTNSLSFCFIKFIFNISVKKIQYIITNLMEI